MGLRFTLRDVPDSPAWIEKRGPADALACEASALRQLSGRPWAPELVHHEAGVLVSTRCPGAPRTLAAAGSTDMRRLGALLREVHDVRRAEEGRVAWWSESASTLADYRARRAEDTERALAGSAYASLARRALAAPLPQPADDDPPFALLHGDLVESNIVWASGRPALVDWEFWRMGDPAEDLAYLFETNRLPGDLIDAVLEGYGLSGMSDRVAAWRALVALDAGAWYAREGMDALARPLLQRGRMLSQGIRASARLAG